jgi:hypothetical protein
VPGAHPGERAARGAGAAALGAEKGRGAAAGEGVAGWGWKRREQRWLSERGQEEKMMLTSGSRVSLRGEPKYNEMYVFVYTCSWAPVVFIHIPWHIRGKSRIAMANFKIREY